MSKPKPVVRKTLVRNPIQKITTKVNDPNKRDSKVSVSSKIEPTSVHSAEQNLTKAKVDVQFSVPEMQTTLQLSKKIDDIVKTKGTKILTGVNKLAVDEKVSRKVNFPYDQPVFKDLIPLMNHEENVPPAIVSKTTVYQKDKEPVLTDFLTNRKTNVGYHKPQNCLKYLDGKSNLASNTCLNLYRVVQVSNVK